MNDFAELEAELKRLEPAPVPDELFARIECALAAPAAAQPPAFSPGQTPCQSFGGRSASG